MTPVGTSIRAVTWNIHGCVGRQGRFDPSAIVQLLRDVDPDVLALQEVDARASRSSGLDTFAYLSATLGLSTPDGDYGHMLLSRWHLVDGRQHDLTVDGREPRRAITGEVRTLGAPLWLLAAHLGLRPGERRAQIERIRGLIDERPEGPAIVLGDFNDWRYPGVSNRALCPPFSSSPRLPSYPSARPLFPLDRIWYRSPLSLQRAWILSEARVYSDHLPVVAELRLLAETAAEARRSEPERYEEL
jgi:endonuclease/exonuclease/phosphatase family metal-dependent hydrolase